MVNEPTETAEAPEASARKSVTLTQGLGGIVGVKAGMTQVYAEDGAAFAVTVIDLQPNIITAVKTKDRDGYQAVQVGLVEKKEKRATKPEKGHAKKAGAAGFYSLQEFRLPDDAKLDGLEIGSLLNTDFLKEGDLVDICAVSKGKGFQGVVKRYHFRGMNRSHGVSVSHRSPGSIGNRADPAKVFKNKKMAGHMGHARVTTQNVRVVKLDLENGVLLVHGAVPGPRSGFVRIRRGVKNASV